MYSNTSKTENKFQKSKDNFWAIYQKEAEIWG